MAYMALCVHRNDQLSPWSQAIWMMIKGTFNLMATINTTSTRATKGQEKSSEELSSAMRNRPKQKFNESDLVEDGYI